MSQLATRERRNSPAPPITCSGCPSTWTAAGAAHCAGCHRTFSSVGLFDRHRTNTGERGTCKDPAVLAGRNGEPICEFRDGMWRFPEMSQEAKLAAFGAR